MMQHRVINVAGDFTRFPAGRFKRDGNFSGERFRDDYLIPALKQADRVTVQLDGTMGYGSSFLEEVFGGLRRNPEFTYADLTTRLKVEARDRSLLSEVEDYLSAPIG